MSYEYVIDYEYLSGNHGRLEHVGAWDLLTHIKEITYRGVIEEMTVTRLVIS